MPRKDKSSLIQQVYAEVMQEQSSLEKVKKYIDRIRKEKVPLGLPIEEGKAVTTICYGSSTVNTLCAVNQAIPLQWPKSLRYRLMEPMLEGPVDDYLIKLLDKYFEGSDADQPTASTEYIGAPTGTCYYCKKNLEQHHQPCNVRYLSVNGDVTIKKKVILRCKTCRINYHFDKFGNKKDGYRFYDEERDAVVANDCMVVDKRLFNLQWSFAQHCWVSFQGFAEAWHDANHFDKEKEIDRRSWADTFWWGEIEAELRECKNIEFRFKSDADREICMQEIDKRRQTGLYPHLEEECTEACKARGCGKLWITDGIWKNQFSHCMFVVKNKVNGMPLLNLPDVCTNEPVPGKAFCKAHCDLCEGCDPPVPSGLRDFLKYSETDGFQLPEETQTKPSSVISEQGGQAFLSDQKDSLSVIANGLVPKTKSRCQKDLGESKTLRKMSRGHQFVVRAGGHIDMWTPLYQSESVGQVFLFLLSWLYCVLKAIPTSMWGGIWIAYDNMCQLTKLKISQKKLPLPKPFDKMWSSVRKCIDALHLKNHVDKRCHDVFNPEQVGDMYPELKDSMNTQAGEQTFVWLGRFKKIMYSMSKTHHLFYLHRLVKRRNSYTTKCYRNGRKPLLPHKKQDNQ